MEPRRNAEQTFHRWIDGEGRLHIVSSLDDVPMSERPKVAPVPLTGVDSLAGAHRSEGSPTWQPEWVSFGAGFGVALVLVLLYRLIPGGARSVTRAALIAGVVMLLAGAYLGLLRRATGTQAGSVLSAPSAIIQDAQRAVDQMNARQKQQEDELRKLQTQGR